MTLAIITLTLGYFVFKFQEILEGSDKTINYNSIQSYYGADKGLNLYESNHSIALSVTGAGDGTTKYDPRYVKMIA